MRNTWKDNGITYVCLCRGIPDTMAGEFKVFEDGGGDMESMRYRTLHKSTKSKNLCLIELYTEPSQCPYIEHTLRQAGCTILGTETDDQIDDINPLRRVGLHASEVTLTHPVSRELLVVKSEVPPNFLQLIQQGSADVNALCSEVNNNFLTGDDEVEEETFSSATKSIKFVTVNDYLKPSNAYNGQSSGSGRDDWKNRRYQKQ